MPSSVVKSGMGSTLDVLGAIVRRRRDLHDLEIVGIFDVLLRDLALIGDAVALAHRHLAQPFELGAKPAAQHEDQMKAGVVGVARGAAARLEFLDGAADGSAAGALGRFREPEIAILQKRPQALARPLGALEPRQHDLGSQRGHVSLPLESVDTGGLGGLWPLARYNRRKRTHAGQALRASFATTSAVHDGGPARSAAAARGGRRWTSIAQRARRRRAIYCRAVSARSRWSSRQAVRSRRRKPGPT